jgi:hydrogenase maturation protease
VRGWAVNRHHAGPARILVAGVGDVFLRDDGFGVEVVRHLPGQDMPPGVRVIDVGVRGVRLAYELLDGCDLLVIVDSAARGESPGTVSVVEADLARDHAAGRAPVIDAHELTPHEVFAPLRRLVVRPDRTLLVACEPADLSVGMGLSERVRDAVPRAVRTVAELVARATVDPAFRYGRGQA